MSTFQFLPFTMTKIEVTYSCDKDIVLREMDRCDLGDNDYGKK